MVTCLDFGLFPQNQPVPEAEEGRKTPCASQQVKKLCVWHGQATTTTHKKQQDE